MASYGTALIQKVEAKAIPNRPLTVLDPSLIHKNTKHDLLYSRTNSQEDHLHTNDFQQIRIY